MEIGRGPAAGAGEDYKVLRRRYILDSLRRQLAPERGGRPRRFAFFSRIIYTRGPFILQKSIPGVNLPFSNVIFRQFFFKRF